MTRPIALLGVPSSAGARRGGQEQGPAALRGAGLVTSLRAHGLEVTDRGDLPRAVYRPDAESPHAQNADLVCHVARQVAAAVAAASAGGAFPVVLGGDCTITIGVLPGLGLGPGVGLLYLDADLDLNTPDTTPSGIFDGMVTAHLLGRGHPELAHLGPRYPLLDEAHLAFFAYDEAGGGIDPPELAALAASAALRYPAAAVRADPLGTARTALAALEQRVERFLVHFDVDVTDTTAVDVPHADGLPLATAAMILGTFLASGRCAGLVVTELNPQLDPEGTAARRLADSLAATLAAARKPDARRGSVAGADANRYKPEP